MSDPDPFEREHRNDPRVVLYLLAGLGGLALLGCLACAGVWGFLVKDRVRQAWKAAQQAQRAAQPVTLPPAEVESLADKQASLKAAFSAADPGVDDATLAGIRQLLDAVVAATGVEDEAVFRKIVDSDRFIEQMKRSGVLSRL